MTALETAELTMILRRYLADKWKEHMSRCIEDIPFIAYGTTQINDERCGF